MFVLSPRSCHLGPSAPSAEPGSSGLTSDCKTHCYKLGFSAGLCSANSGSIVEASCQRRWKILDDVLAARLTFSSAALSASLSSRSTPWSSASGSAPGGPSRCWTPLLPAGGDRDHLEKKNPFNLKLMLKNPNNVLKPTLMIYTEHNQHWRDTFSCIPPFILC